MQYKLQKNSSKRDSSQKHKDMKNLIATYVPGIENMPKQKIFDTLKGIERHEVNCLNWNEYPYAPQVGFHIAFSDKVIALLWEVTEDHVRAVSLEDNGPVWEDSCVEFFVDDPNSPEYFNFEMNCIGTMLASKRRSRSDGDHFGPEKMGIIRNFGSLEHKVIDNQEANQKWWRVTLIPFSVIGQNEVPASLRCNFYKCGDNCARPHYLSWTQIGTPEPNFHCLEFFGEVLFTR